MPAVRPVRVLCVDGPCRGLQFLDLDTGRILLEGHPSGPAYIYRVEDHAAAITDFGPSRVAYFEHTTLTGIPAPSA
jgi:hypothetical protein